MIKHLNILLIVFALGHGVLSAQNFWRQTSGPNAGPVSSLVSHPDGSQFAGTTDGVFKTTNAGISWISILSGLGNVNVLALAVTPNGTVIAGTQAGVYRLTNQGSTWQQTSLTGAQVQAVGARSSAEIYAGLLGAGVFKSTNDGASWNPTTLGNATPSSFAFSGSTGPVFAGTASGVFRSTDAGIQWIQINNGLTNTTIRALAFENSGVILAGTVDAGMFRSTNDGALWLPANDGLSTQVIHSLAINSFGHAFVGTNAGVFRSIDKGLHWQAINGGLSDPDIRALAVNSSGFVFAGGSNGHVFRSALSTEGTFTVVQPNGGEDWQIGTVQQIRWTSTQVTGRVRIELTRDAGGSHSIIVDSAANTGVYPLTITGPATTQARIRISSYEDPVIRDSSDALFSISTVPAATITVLTPNGGEVWQVGTTQSIQWTSTNLSGKVKIELSRNGGSAFTVITDSTNNTGTFPWSVTAPPTAQGRVRISSVVNGTVLDISDNNFTISLPPSITVVVPNGGEDWQVGTTQNIQWASVNVPGKVRIEISRNGGSVFTVIVNSTNNTGTFPWSVTAPPTAQGRVRISSVVNGTVLDISDNNFTISLPPSIAVSSPNGGENWLIGTTQNIQWTSTNIPGKVKIELSRNGGSAFTAIVDSTNNTGSFPWSITGPATSQGRVRISSIASAATVDVSDTNFTISPAPSITVAVPNGGEAWQIGTTQNILWTSTNVPGKVRVEISRDGAQTFATITDSTNNAGTFPWPVTAPVTGQARVRIASISTGGPLDVSDNNFTISPLPSVGVVRPNGGEAFQIGSLDTIRWSSVGVAGSARIEISRNGGLTFAVIDTNAPNSGMYPWRVTGPATPIPRIRIAFPRPGLSPLADTSDNDFAINALSVTAPDTVSSQTSPTIVVRPPGGYVATSARLFVRNGGKTVYDSLALTQVGANLQASIPPNYINIRGVQFYVRLSNAQGSITFPDSTPALRPAAIRVRLQNVVSTSIFQRRIYKMVSVPLDLTDPSLARTFIDDYGQYNRSKWRLFRWEGTGYTEFPGIGATVIPGNSFWLITHAGTAFDADEGLSVTTQDSFRVSIPPGWSQIADPYAFRIDWNAVVGGSLLLGPYFYDRGSYRAATIRVLQPWEGYFVYNGGLQSVSIAIPPVEADSTLPPLNDWPEGSSYSLRLAASALGSGLADAENIVGFASSFVGEKNFPEPPMISDEFIRLTVVEGSENHLLSLKRVPAKGAFWDMKLSTTLQNMDIRIQMSEHGQLPQGFEIFVLDKDNGALIPVQAAVFNVYFRTITRSLRVVVGTRKFAEDNSEDIPLVPLQYDLSQNYPNPFNPETKIRYQLSKRSQVKLEIFNVVGQRIRTLVNSEQTTGSYELAWDGTNEAGRLVGSGVYMYRLQAEASAGSPNDRYAITHKMVLIR